MECAYCGTEMESPVARYTVTKSSDGRETVSANVACPKPECIEQFFKDLKETGMMNPESWDSVEFYPRPPES